MLGLRMESAMVFMIGSVATVVALWHMVQLIHYLGWRRYDIEHGTEYRFNEGAPADWAFRVPMWLERGLRNLERNSRLGAKFRDPAK